MQHKQYNASYFQLCVRNLNIIYDISEFFSVHGKLFTSRITGHSFKHVISVFLVGHLIHNNMMYHPHHTPYYAPHVWLHISTAVISEEDVNSEKNLLQSLYRV